MSESNPNPDMLEALLKTPEFKDFITKTFKAYIEQSKEKEAPSPKKPRKKREPKVKKVEIEKEVLLLEEKKSEPVKKDEDSFIFKMGTKRKEREKAKAKPNTFVDDLTAEKEFLGKTPPATTEKGVRPNELVSIKCTKCGEIVRKRADLIFTEAFECDNCLMRRVGRR